MSALTGEDFPATLRIGGSCRPTGERLGDDVLVVEGAYLLGMAAFWQADFAAARTHLETAVARYRPADLPTHLVRYGQDPKVACLSRLGNTLWFLGDPDAARRARDDALAWAERIAQPFSIGIALLFGAMLAVDMADEPALRELTARLAALTPRRRPSSWPPTRWKATSPSSTGTDRRSGLPAIDAAVRAAEAPEPRARRARDPGPHPARRGRRGGRPRAGPRRGGRAAHDGWRRGGVGARGHRVAAAFRDTTR